jgi:anti-sigma B factor antagonist
MVSTDLSTVEYNSHAVVVLRGELDVTDAAEVAAALAGVVSRQPNVIIDLTGLEYIDCGGLRALAGAQEQARQTGGDLLLAAPQLLVLRLLSLTGLADVSSVRTSVERAWLGQSVRADESGPGVPKARTYDAAGPRLTFGR